MEDTCVFKERGIFIQYDYVGLYDINNIDLLFFPCCYYATENHQYPFGRIKVNEFLNLPNDKLLEYLNNIRHRPLNFSKKPDISSCVFPCNCIGKELKYLNISLDRSCNLHCRMCRKDIVIDKLETEIYYKILNKCRNLNLDILEFTTAGEPFLYKDRLLEFLETLTTKDTKQVNFITNGTLLDKEYIDKLEQIKIKNGINISICVSIDSINEVGYKIVRGGDFNKVIENTEYLNSKKLLDMVLCTISLPVLYQVPNVKDFWHKKGINVAIHLAKPIKTEGIYPLTIKEYEFCKNSDIWAKSGIEIID